MTSVTGRLEMKQAIDADTVFAEIVMQRAADDRPIILVEGPEDVSALDSHIREDCLMLLTAGNSALMGAIRLSDQQGIDRVVAISDLDWSGVLYTANPSPNVVYTDHYDLDATILACPGVIARVTAAHCDRGKVGRLLALTQTKSLLDLAIRIASVIGALRLVSIRESLGLNLRSFPIEQVVEWPAYMVDPARLAEIAIARSRDITITSSELESLLKAEMSLVSSPLRYCSGHDLLSALAAIMRRGGGGTDGAAVLSRVIRSAFSCPDLQSTTLHQKVSGWAETRAAQVWAC